MRGVRPFHRPISTARLQGADLGGRYPVAMINVLLRWSIPLAALFLLGPIAALFTYSLHASDGGGEATLLLSTSVGQGIAAAAVALLLALGIGIAGARYIEQRSGLLAAGFVLAWAAWGLGRTDRVLALHPANSTLYTLALECTLLILPAALVAMLILRVPTRVPKFIAAGDTTRNLADRTHHEPTVLKEKSAIAAVLGGAAGAALGVWLVAQDFNRGQTFGAAVVGGVLAAAAGRLASQRVSPVYFLIGLMLVGVIGPIVATFVHPSSFGPASAAIAGTLMPLARPLPLDWLAGGFVGIPFGLWWAGAMLEKQGPAKDDRRPRR